MNKHSVIFIEHPEVEYDRLNQSESIHRKNKFFSYFLLSPRELPKRIRSSFVPPGLSGESRKVYVDMVGPLIAVLLLGCVLHYGHANKHPPALAPTSPTVALLYYMLVVPAACVLFAKIGNANLSPQKIISLIGYGMYGHLFTVASSFLYDFETSNFYFFLVMTVFGGLSCFRIVIVLLVTIPKPIARLIICSLVSIFHLLFLIFIHFAYMHRTFTYGKKS